MVTPGGCSLILKNAFKSGFIIFLEQNISKLDQAEIVIRVFNEVRVLDAYWSIQSQCEGYVQPASPVLIICASEWNLI